MKSSAARMLEQPDCVQALDACERITRTEAANFYYGLRLLPREKRRALYAVYAWMRAIDDVADDDGLSPDERNAQLTQLESLTRDAFAGRPHDDVLSQALAAVVRVYPLDLQEFLAALEGQRMDLAPRVYCDFSELETYCDRVASTVGRICVSIWGVERGIRDAAVSATLSSHHRAAPLASDGDASSDAVAAALATQRGIAFQLTNILRDIVEDHARGRCYLPADELSTAGLTTAALLEWRDPAACARFMHVQCARAERIFAASAPLEAMLSRDSRATSAAMNAIYRAILRKIARDPRRALSHRVRLSRWTKTMIALRARLGLLDRAYVGTKS